MGKAYNAATMCSIAKVGDFDEVCLALAKSTCSLALGDRRLLSGICNATPKLILNGRFGPVVSFYIHGGKHA